MRTNPPTTTQRNYTTKTPDKNNNLTLSIDESIQKLKAEIIAQDWRLPQRRIEPLTAAFTCLRNRFKNRKNLFAILTMANNVLKYLEKHDSTVHPDFIEFLKEAMAHVVNIYEENKLAPDKEAQLFKKMYSQFNCLQQKVRGQNTNNNQTK